MPAAAAVLLACLMPGLCATAADKKERRGADLDPKALLQKAVVGADRNGDGALSIEEFERVRIGFGKGGLEAMELKDQFGQTTVIKFADVVRNPKLPPETFSFAPPPGADVIRE